MTPKKKKVMVEHGEFDWSAIDGATLKVAGEYLLKLAKTLPDDAIIDEHWTGYEDMEVRVISYRVETDAEYQERKEWEEWLREYDKKLRIKDYEKAKRREEYLRLKGEFG